MPAFMSLHDRYTHATPSSAEAAAGAVTAPPQSGGTTSPHTASVSLPVFCALPPAEAHTPSLEAAPRPASGQESNATETKSPLLRTLSTSGSVHPPVTPRNWMVRGTSSGQGSPAALPALGTHATHESAASVSSLTSSVGNPTLSPFLRPRGSGLAAAAAGGGGGGGHPGSGQECASEAEGADPAFVVMERASGRKRTPRSTAISGLGCSSFSTSNAGAAAAAVGVDSDAAATPTSTRLVLSRRTSASGTVYDSEDDTTNAHTQGAAEVYRGSERQSALRSSRSRAGSGVVTAATTTTPRTSSPLTSSLPPLTPGSVMMAGARGDVPAAMTATELPTRRSTSSPPTAVASATQPTACFTSTTAAAAASVSASPGSVSSGVAPPVAAAPSTTRTRRSRSPSSPHPLRDASNNSSHSGGSTDAGSCCDVGSACTATRHGYRGEPPVAAPATAEGVDHTTREVRVHPSPPHFSRPLSSGGVADVAVGVSPTRFTASHHFADTAQLPSWPHYSTVSSCASLMELGNASAAAAVEEDGGEEEKEEATVHYQRRAVGASATTPSCAVPSVPTCATFTTLPRNSSREAVTNADSMDGAHPSRQRAAAAAEMRHHTENCGGFFAAAPAVQRTDVWTVCPTSGAVSRAQIAGRSRSSSCSKSVDGVSHHHDHHGQHHQKDAVPRRSFTTLAVSGASTAPLTTTTSPVNSTPVLSGRESHQPAPRTALAHNSGNFLSYRPTFSRVFSSRFSTPRGAVTPPDVGGENGSGPALMVSGGLGGGGGGGAAAVGVLPPPPPPPPPSRIPSPLLRAAANVTCGFGATPIHQRVSSNRSTGNLTAQSSGRVTPASAGGLHFGMCSPPPPPPSPSAEAYEAAQPRRHCSRSRASSSPPLSDAYSPPHHTATANTAGDALDDGGGALQGTLSARTLLSCRSTPDGMGSVETAVDGIPIMVVPPVALRCTQEGGAPTMPLYPQGHPTSSQHHHHSHRAQSNRVRDSSLGSCSVGGGGSGSAARNSPFPRTRPAAPPTALVMGQSREFLYTSESSLNTSTPQMLTSTASDPMLLSFSSANLAVPMASTGSNNTNASNCCTLKANGGSVAPAVAGGVSTPTTAAGQSAVDAFVMRPDAETVQSLPRGKVPRMPGCSMRDWTAHLAAKESEKRRAQQQQQHGRYHQQHGSGSGRASGAGAGVGGVSGPANAAPAYSRGVLPRMTPQEVAPHNTPDDLWIVVRNVVYDCTMFQRFHPGGEKLLLACAGRDATQVYDRFHAWVSCESFLGPYAVGVLAPPH